MIPHCLTAQTPKPLLTELSDSVPQILWTLCFSGMDCVTHWSYLLHGLVGPWVALRTVASTPLFRPKGGCWASTTRSDKERPTCMSRGLATRPPLFLCSLETKESSHRLHFHGSFAISAPRCEITRRWQALVSDWQRRSNNTGSHGNGAVTSLPL